MQRTEEEHTMAGKDHSKEDAGKKRGIEESHEDGQVPEFIQGSHKADHKS